MIGHPLMTDLPQWLEDVWLQRYLDRLLDDQESTWFESYAMSRPVLMSAIDADNDLRDAVAMLPADAAAPAATSKAAANDPPTVTGAARVSWFAPMAQAAALVLALFAGGWLNSRLNPPEELPLGIASPTRIVFDTMRSGESEPLVQLGDPKAGYVLIEVAVPVDAEDVRVQTSAGEYLPLSVSDEGFASFLLRSRELAKIKALRLLYRTSGHDMDSELELVNIPTNRAK